MDTGRPKTIHYILRVISTTNRYVCVCMYAKKRASVCAELLSVVITASTLSYLWCSCTIEENMVEMQSLARGFISLKKKH